MKQRKKLGTMELLIRALVVIVFCAAVALTVGLLMELNQTRREIEALQKEKERLEQALEDGAEEGE